MMKTLLRGCAIALCFSACLSSIAQAQEQPPTDEEAFILQISIGRQSVLIDRAFDGIGVKIPYVLRENGGIGADPADLWLGLREAGRDGVVLKEIACAKGLVGPKRCAAAKPPTWIDAQPTPVPHLATIDAYYEELSAFLEPFIDVGCRKGRARTKDELFCSVE